MKYIGPFLRINSINKNNISSELFHLSKESLKYIILNSKCGIQAPISSFTNENLFSDNEINKIKNFSPLLCIYKKSNSKLIKDHNKLIFDETTFKKEINISSNAFMTLSILELMDYYKKFKNINKDKYLYFKLYKKLCENQLIFYATHLRNAEGIFVDKIQSNSSNSKDLILENKNKKLKFSHQAFLMAAYYKFSCECDSKYKNDFKSFSLDILNMLLDSKDDIYSLSFEELNKVCFALNVFYSYSNNLNAKNLLLDICDLLTNMNDDIFIGDSKNATKNKCLLFINLNLLNKNANVIKFSEIEDKLFIELVKLYDENLGIFFSPDDDKKITLTSIEIILYLTCILMRCYKVNNKDYNAILYNVFKYQIVNSGLILSWPQAPNLDDVERYKNFSLKSDDLLDEQYFIMPNILTPEKTFYAPIFLKNICFNTKKECFKQKKLSFYSESNMSIFFVLLYIINHNL